MSIAAIKGRSQWAWVAEAIGSYWSSYGGWSMVFTSPFFHASVIITCLLTPSWISGALQSNALDVIPAMLGFSLAAFTFSLGIGTDRFRLILGARRAGNKPSLVDGLSTSFVHFLFIQTLALLINLLAKTHWVAFLLAEVGSTWDLLPRFLQVSILIMKWLLSGASALVFIYAMLSGIPTVLHVYMVAKVFEKFSSKYVKPGKGSASNDGSGAG